MNGMKKVNIYTADSYRAIQSAEECLLAKYQFPEKYKSPLEQIEWFRQIIEKIKISNESINIVTFSPYILNYINISLAKGDINAEEIDVVEFSINEEDGEDVLNEHSLKMQDEKGNWIIDTFTFSEPMSFILNEWLAHAKK